MALTDSMKCAKMVLWKNVTGRLCSFFYFFFGWHRRNRQVGGRAWRGRRFIKHRRGGVQGWHTSNSERLLTVGCVRCAALSLERLCITKSGWLTATAPIQRSALMPPTSNWNVLTAITRNEIRAKTHRADADTVQTVKSWGVPMIGKDRKREQM